MTEDPGTYRKYANINFSADRLDLVRRAAAISDDYEQRGYVLTLRQLYYQFVAKGLIENSQRSYDKLGSAVSDGRLAGLISWTALEDRNRNLQGHTTFDGPAQAIKQQIDEYKIDKWANQDWRPEVWVEKDALTGVISDICLKLGVNFFACKGYNSQSAQWRAGQRMAGYIVAGQRPIVFHLGDHDPSGIDMTRDNQERLSLFAGAPVQVVRLALNMPQIEELRPPPNPVKLSDSRKGPYIEQYGDSCWELDALDPEYIHRLINDNVMRLRDAKRWEEMVTQEAEDIRVMQDVFDELQHIG